MTADGPPDISGLIAAWADGDEQALSSLMSAVYPELRRIARRQLGRRQAGQTLESAALANEAYLKLIRAGGIRCENRVHFLALCSQIIRRILVDHARGRGYAKRGGHAERVPLDDALLGAQARGIEILALNEALELLAEIDARQARVVELRYFGGLSVEETAEVLGNHASAGQARLEEGQGVVVWRADCGARPHQLVTGDTGEQAGRLKHSFLRRHHGSYVWPVQETPRGFCSDCR